MLKLIQGNCLDAMATLPDGCVDMVLSLIYHTGDIVHGKKWDRIHQRKLAPGTAEDHWHSEIYASHTLDQVRKPVRGSCIWVVGGAFLPAKTTETNGPI